MQIPAPVQQVLNTADVQIDGERPWDIQVHDPSLWRRILWGGSLAMGDAYVDGGWDCAALDELFSRLLQAGADHSLAQGRHPRMALQRAQDLLLNLQTPGRSLRAVRRHYDVHPQVYAAMLDPLRIYSCGYWEHAGSLEEAQQHKLRLICEKLKLQRGQCLLDIGCGWGGLVAFAAENYGVAAVGVTLSVEQLLYARRQWSHLPVRFELCDYRQLERLAEPPFDRIVSVGMLEHVGPRNLATFSSCIRRCLRSDGLALLHTIGSRQRSHRTDAWIDTHIFPDGRLPSPGQLAEALEPQFLIEDWQNFGPDYDLTLLAWYRRFEAAWPQLRWSLAATGQLADPDRFRRFWRYYLLSCAGFFRARQGQLWQLVLSPAAAVRVERLPVYRSIRPDAALLRRR